MDGFGQIQLYFLFLNIYWPSPNKLEQWLMLLHGQISPSCQTNRNSLPSSLLKRNMKNWFRSSSFLKCKWWQWILVCFLLVIYRGSLMFDVASGKKWELSERRVKYVKWRYRYHSWDIFLLDRRSFIDQSHQSFRHWLKYQNITYVPGVKKKKKKKKTSSVFLLVYINLSRKGEIVVVL